MKNTPHIITTRCRRHLILLAALLTLTVTACQPYLNTADQLDIRRINDAITQARMLSSYATTATTTIEQRLTTSFGPASITLNSDVSMQADSQSQRNARGLYDTSQSVQVEMDMRTSGMADVRLRGALTYDMVLLGTDFYMRVTGDPIFEDAVDVFDQWIYADMRDFFDLLPVIGTDFVSLSGFETFDSYPLTPNTVRDLRRPSATTVNGVPVNGYRFDLDMMRVLDEIGFEEVSALFAGLDEFAELDELGAMLGQDFDFFAIARDFYRDSRVTITVWLDDTGLIRRVDTDQHIRADVTIAGMRLQLNQRSQERVIYTDFNAAFTIAAPI